MAEKIMIKIVAAEWKKPHQKNSFLNDSRIIQIKFRVTTYPNTKTLFKTVVSILFLRRPYKTIFL
jgi:hypothetical protein